MALLILLLKKVLANPNAYDLKDNMTYGPEMTLLGVCTMVSRGDVVVLTIYFQAIISHQPTCAPRDRSWCERLLLCSSFK